MGKRTDWQVIEPLGGGGQSDVYLVRAPARIAERQKSIDRLKEFSSLNLDDKTAGCRTLRF